MNWLLPTADEAQNSITIPNVLATDKITIKLRTVCDGADTFYAWYEEALGENYARTGNYYEICDENKDPLGESQVSYEFFMADCSTFFNSTTNKLARNTLDFYSDIIHVSAFANLTYKYYDRFAALVIADLSAGPLRDAAVNGGDMLLVGEPNPLFMTSEQRKHQHYRSVEAGALGFEGGDL